MKIFTALRLAILILAVLVTVRECQSGNFKGPWARGWLGRALATPAPTARPSVDWCAQPDLPKIGEVLKVTQAAAGENRGLVSGEPITVKRLSTNCRQFQARRSNGQILWLEVSWWITPLD